MKESDDAYETADKKASARKHIQPLNQRAKAKTVDARNTCPPHTLPTLNVTFQPKVCYEK